MKTRLLLALFWLAIGFPAAALAQEQNAVTPRVREGIEDVLKKYEEAYNRHDAAAVAGLYTEDGVEARLFPTNEGGGTFSGRHVLVQRESEKSGLGIS
jgi:hypothetical protein